MSNKIEKPTISNKDLRKLYWQKVPKSSQHKISFNLPGHNDKIKVIIILLTLSI